MMYVVYVAVCLASTPVSECSRETAQDWLVAPEQTAGLSGCQVHGMQYVATSHLVTEGTYPKVFCTPRNAG